LYLKNYITSLQSTDEAIKQLCRQGVRCTAGVVNGVFFAIADGGVPVGVVAGTPIGHAVGAMHRDGVVPGAAIDGEVAVAQLKPGDNAPHGDWRTDAEARHFKGSAVCGGVAVAGQHIFGQQREFGAIVEIDQVLQRYAAAHGISVAVGVDHGEVKLLFGVSKLGHVLCGTGFVAVTRVDAP